MTPKAKATYPNYETVIDLLDRHAYLMRNIPINNLDYAFLSEFLAKYA